jgi:signal transduction histidine kinase
LIARRDNYDADQFIIPSMTICRMDHVIKSPRNAPLSTIHASPWLTKLARIVEFDTSSSHKSDKRRDLIQIQWFVVIACSYLLIIENGEIVQDSTGLFLVALPLLTIAVILRLPESIFEHRFFPACMVLVDTLLFFIAIIFNRQSPWDLCLIFFFGILVAAIGENLIQVIIGSLIIGILSVLIVPLASDGNFEIHSNTLLRIPLLFGAALVYGHLADRVKRERKKTAQLEEMRRQQLSTKDAFISHVSHELRTPITAIYQFVTILSDEIAGPINNDQREYLEIIDRNVKQLQAMVGDLLEATRATGNKLTIDPRVLCLQKLVPEVLSNYRASATAKSVALSGDIPEKLPFVFGDPVRVKQVLSNLIDNALKFTPSDGKIFVTGHIDTSEPRMVCVSVIDNGCGISPHATERVFDRLYQEETFLDTNRKGLGLGLYLCHELITRQNGRIWVESELGKGSTFCFTLPSFSLRGVLMPFFEQSHSFPFELGVISVKVMADDRIVSSEIGKAVWGEKWDRLKRFHLPSGTILLPRMTVAGQPEQFFIISLCGNESTIQLALHIEKEIGQHRRKADTQHDVKTAFHSIALPAEKCGDIDAVLDVVSREIFDLAGLRTSGNNKYEVLPVKIPSAAFN